MRVATDRMLQMYSYYKISIHATHAGGDQGAGRRDPSRRDFNPRHPCGWRRVAGQIWNFSPLFQSTPPMRVATPLPQCCCCICQISIHATHAGGDIRHEFGGAGRIYFNPRHPCGWRPTAVGKVFFPTKFQSTPPMRVATDAVALVLQTEYISIHATHAGGDGNALAN